MLYSFLKPFLFALDPESAHHLALQLAHLSPELGKLTGAKADPHLAVTVGHVKWSFPIGLAAGLDKNAEALPFLSHQGFGAIECGTVTVRPQEGNPRPRMFRYPEEASLRNAMGFPNHGLLALIPELKSYQGLAPLGVNLGKNKDTDAHESIEELSILFDTLKDLAQYFVINVSSPNTPGLRALQEKGYLSELFTTLNQHRGDKDLYLKIAPDLAPDKIKELTGIAADFGLTGMIATNTTIMPERGAGGISGQLLHKKSKEVRQLILAEQTQLEVIAVGGISESQDLFDFWNEGGKVAQVYTAYVYQGPELLKKFKRDLLKFTTETNMNLESFFKLSLTDRQYYLKNFKI